MIRRRFLRLFGFLPVVPLAALPAVARPPTTLLDLCLGIETSGYPDPRQPDDPYYSKSVHYFVCRCGNCRRVELFECILDDRCKCGRQWIATFALSLGKDGRVVDFDPPRQ